MNLNDLMTSFAQKQGIDELDFRDDKYHLILEDKIELTCFQANGICYFHGLLGPLPEQPADQEALLTQLLKTNLSLINMQRASLCIEPDNKYLGLYLTQSLQALNEVALEDALLNYVHCYETLTQDIGNPKHSQIASGPMILMP
ncbi:MAG: CesT family type III secretion system chaperone [Endozoicomonas sp. (ex Botrylloides leachii)]|nr:CesT family type III secretion system chaperone [Endozoicomonas sp. (ex Botrylloides leachii)]